MNLRDYLFQENIKKQDFAKLIGVANSTVTRLSLPPGSPGGCKPSLDLALKIEEITDGKVTVQSWGGGSEL